MIKTSTPGSASRPEAFRTMLDNLRNLRESPIKNAFYNLMVLASIGSVVLVFFVFRPFFKPLLWAFLIGAILFPLKCRISGRLLKYVESMDAQKSNILFMFAKSPWSCLRDTGESIYNWIKRHVVMILIVLILGIVWKLGVLYAPKGILCFIWRNIRSGHEFCYAILSSLSTRTMTAIIAVYIGLVYFFWEPKNATLFAFAGQSMWFFVIAYCCGFLGALRVPIFMTVMIYLMIAFIMQLRTITDAEGHTILEKITFIYGQHTKQSKAAVLDETDDNNGISLERDSIVKPVESESSIYFRYLFYACLATLIYQNILLTILLALPVVIYLIKELFRISGIDDYVDSKVIAMKSAATEWFNDRRAAVVPLCWPGIQILNGSIHKMIADYLKNSVDMISTTLVVILLVCGVIVSGIFLGVEIYSETITVIELGNDVVNWTISNRPDLKELMPESIQVNYETFVENAHKSGTDAIDGYITELLKDVDPQHMKKLKVQVLNIWDRIIQQLLEKNDPAIHGPKVSQEAITLSLNDFMNNEVTQNTIMSYVKANIGAVMDILDSVYMLLKQNIAIVTSMIGAIFTAILGGGQFVVTLIVDSIIFFTALFYLLNSSKENYAPMEAVKYFGFSSGPRVASAISQSVSSVLIATFKLALFHGLFTWLTHNIFGARIVYLPTVCATQFAAIPFLGTYWCALPAFLDLWLAQDRFYSAALLMLIHFIIPSSFVDPAIYSEITGAGHPYLTGLSIAGGMYWLGWEGALFGPIFLCLVVVIFELLSASLRESPIASNTVSVPK